MLKQIRLLIFGWIIHLGLFEFVLPKDSQKTLLWLMEMPLED